jgi:HD-GYP domain-containing protein (c-di-GMP phosphodiesterase class II)
MEALMQVLESTMSTRDPYTVGHQRRVSQIACAIGKEMGLSEDRLRDLRMAGMLHDLGKFAIPSDLLSKPGKLTPPEFALIKTHPQVAYNILKPISLPGKTAEIILQHHERLNGSGYPQGLQGEEILLESRILGVADVMEAMCSHRPYRASLGLAETLDELIRNRGILYDAAVVDTCLKLYGNDLQAPWKVSSGLTPLEAMMPSPPDRWNESSRPPETAAGGGAVPRAAAGKGQNWAILRDKKHRAWMHLGSASLMGWLIMSSFRGF